MGSCIADDEDFTTDRLRARSCQDRTVLYANQDRISSGKEWKWKSVGKDGERMCAGRTVRWPVSRGRGQVNAHRLAPPPHTMEPGDHRTVSSLSSASPLPPVTAPPPPSYASPLPRARGLPKLHRPVRVLKPQYCLASDTILPELSYKETTVLFFKERIIL